MRGRIAIVIAVLSVSVTSTVRAQDDLPVGRFGFVGGFRQNTGQLGDDFGLGYLIGVEAGYQPSSLAKNFSLGVSWEVLWGQFDADNPELVETELSVLEMNFGLRLRRAIGEAEPQFFVAAAGVTLFRTSIPVPPDSDRLYVGPYAGVGLDRYLAGRYLLSFEARYGLIAYGPSSLSLVLAFSFGSR